MAQGRLLPDQPGSRFDLRVCVDEECAQEHPLAVLGGGLNQGQPLGQVQASDGNDRIFAVELDGRLTARRTAGVPGQVQLLHKPLGLGFPARRGWGDAGQGLGWGKQRLELIGPHTTEFRLGVRVLFGRVGSKNAYTPIKSGFGVAEHACFAWSPLFSRSCRRYRNATCQRSNVSLS